MSESKDAGFLERWSRLKREGGELPPETKDVEAAVSPAEEERVVTAPAPTVPAEEVPAPLTDADMPPIESLTEASDFSQFLSEGVSDTLRRRALRKLFALPEFNIRDGLNDYDDDFSEFIPLGDTVTYQMKQWLQRQADAAAEAVDPAVPTEPAVRETTEAAESLDDPVGDEDDDLGNADG